MKFLVKANETIAHLYFYMTIEELTEINKLNEAFNKSSKISYWKESTQRYKANLLPNNIRLQEELRNGTYKVSKTVDFTLNERGKIRQIRAPSMRDRIVQKVLCNEVLVPQLSKPLIYDNYASLKGRGTSFARKRIEVMLRRFIAKNGNNGYILQVDIKRYFDSINHDILKQMIHKKVNESKQIMDLIDYVVDSSSDSDVGLNLGSEAPQIFAVYYLSAVDNYIKSVKGVKYYGRYMDDIFILSDNKEELKVLLKDIQAQLEKVKLEINTKKTHITKLSHGFTFMQIKYNIAGNKIIKRPTRSKITRERRRLKKYRKLADKKLMSETDVFNCYKSWRNGLKKDCNACDKSIESMDKLYNRLFPEHEINRKQTREELIRQAYKDLDDFSILNVTR